MSHIPKVFTSDGLSSLCSCLGADSSLFSHIQHQLTTYIFLVFKLSRIRIFPFSCCPSKESHPIRNFRLQIFSKVRNALHHLWKFYSRTLTVKRPLFSGTQCILSSMCHQNCGNIDNQKRPVTWLSKSRSGSYDPTILWSHLPKTIQIFQESL